MKRGIVFHQGRRTAGLSLAALLLVSVLSGCAECDCETVPSTASPTSGESQAATVTKPVVETAFVEDELGAYTRETVNAEPIPWRNILAPSLAEAELVDLQNWIVNFVKTEVLDSVALDDPSKLESWYESTAPDFLHPDYLYSLASSGYIAPRALLFSTAPDQIFEVEGKTNGLPFSPKKERDGKSRVAAKEFFAAELLEASQEAYEGDSVSYEPVYRIYISGYLKFEFNRDEILAAERAKEEAILISAELQDFDMGYTIEEAMQRVETWMDELGNPDTFKTESQFSLQYSVQWLGDSWKITSSGQVFESPIFWANETYRFDPVTKTNIN